MLKLFILALAFTSAYGDGCTEDCSATNRVCFIEVGVCMCMPGYVGAMCETECDITLTNETEIRLTAEQYGLFTKCTWRNRPGTVTHVEVIEFDVEMSDSCDYFDTMSIHGQFYCGHNVSMSGIPTSFDLKGDDVIDFYTNSEITRDGFLFKLTYPEQVPEIPTTSVPGCTLEEISGYPNSFLLGGYVMHCPLGTKFDKSICSCIHL